MSEEFSKQVLITPTIRSQLCAERDRTGKTPIGLLRGRNDVPSGLNVTSVLSWMVEPFGALIEADGQHLNYILDCWAKEPDKLKMGHKSTRIKVTQTYLDELTKEQERTGLNISAFFRMIARDKQIIKPTGVNEHMVRAWQSGQIKQAYPEFLDFVIDTYKKQPDENPSGIESTIKKYEDLRRASLENISEKDWKKLDQYRELGFLPTRVIKLSQDVPDGLDVVLIKYWLRKFPVKVDPILLKWVLKRCREFQKFKI